MSQAKLSLTHDRYQILLKFPHITSKFKAMLSYLCLLLLCYSSSVSCTKNIFLLAGQSNMSGRGGVTNDTWDGVVPLECKASPSIMRLNAGLTWEVANEPLHVDIDTNKTCGIGPGMAFANSLLSRDSSLQVVALVPCAIGGTNISEWARGTHLYNQLVTRASAAVRGGGTIRAMLWYQGESDTISQADAELYEGRMENFITDLRADLVSLLPVIQVALASGQGPYVELVREAQLGIELPNVWCVDAKGSQLEPYGLHLSAPAQVRLGKMLADAFIQTVAKPIPMYSSAPKSYHNFVFSLFIDPIIRYLRMIFDLNEIF